MLRRYAEAIQPWAERTAAKMLEDVDKRDYQNWMQQAEAMGKYMRRELTQASTGHAMQELMADQVHLIKSIPLEAAQRVHELAIKAIEQGSRADEIAAEILRSGEVAASRAATIARTETSRAQTTLKQARAEAVGSTHYVWRTSQDGNVRSDHKKLNGKVFAWDDPPVADERSGARAHPGCIYNCRCFAVPVIPD